MRWPRSRINFKALAELGTHHKLSDCHFKTPSQSQTPPGKEPETAMPVTDGLLFGVVDGLPYILVSYQPTKPRTPDTHSFRLVSFTDFLKLYILSLGDSLIQSRHTLAILSTTLLSATLTMLGLTAREMRTRLYKARRCLTVRLARTRSLVRFFLPRTYLRPSNSSSVATQSLPKPSGEVIRRPSSTRHPEPKAP